MKYLEPSGRESLPALISVTEETAVILREMASELEVSLDELLSGIAEESVIGLCIKDQAMHDVVIPTRCSRQDLLDSLQSR